MKKIWYIVSIILMVLLCVGFYVYKRVHSGCYLLEKILEVENEAEDIDKEYVRKEIERIAEELRYRIRGIKDNKKIAEIFRRYFLKEWGFKYIEKDISQSRRGRWYSQGEYISFEDFLKNRRGICYNITMFFVVIGEYLDLPIYPVLAPNHMFPAIVYDRSWIDIERPDWTREQVIEFFRERCRDISDIVQMENGVYMRLLPKEVIVDYCIKNVIRFLGMRENMKNV